MSRHQIVFQEELKVPRIKIKMVQSSRCGRDDKPAGAWSLCQAHGPHSRWTLKFRYGLIIASEVLQPSQESHERRGRLLLTAGVGLRGPPADALTVSPGSGDWVWRGSGTAAGQPARAIAWPGCYSMSFTLPGFPTLHPPFSVSYHLCVSIKRNHSCF